MNDRIASLSVMTHRRPTGVVGGLGYRGFTITRHDPAFTASGQIRVHEAILDRGVSVSNLVDDTEVEKFLLSTFPGKISVEARDHVSSRIKSQSNFGLNTDLFVCPACKAADAPAYNPAIWNGPATQPFNNCYNYANDQPTGTFAQPGRAHGVSFTTTDCAHVQPAAVADGLMVAPNFAAPLKSGAGWYLALVIWPGADYHWYRQDSDGCWSHKPGHTAARNIDNVGKSIADPKTCDRGPYSVFCNYMVTKRGLAIA